MSCDYKCLHYKHITNYINSINRLTSSLALLLCVLYSSSSLVKLSSITSVITNMVLRNLITKYWKKKKYYKISPVPGQELIAVFFLFFRCLKGRLQCWQHCHVFWHSSEAFQGWISILTSPITFTIFKHWTCLTSPAPLSTKTRPLP